MNYENETENKLDHANATTHLWSENSEVNVTGGRDHRLLNLLAKHMNFKLVYVEAPGRTHGSLRTDDETNLTFTGAIGLLQSKVSFVFNSLIYMHFTCKLLYDKINAENLLLILL